MTATNGPAGRTKSSGPKRHCCARRGTAWIGSGRTNNEFVLSGFVSRAQLEQDTVWSWRSYRELRALIGRERPGVAHLYSPLPLISPAAYCACREAGYRSSKHPPTIGSFVPQPSSTVMVISAKAVCARECLGRGWCTPATGIWGCTRCSVQGLVLFRQRRAEEPCLSRTRKAAATILRTPWL